MAVENRRAPLTERQVENMLTVLIRRKEALEQARRQLAADGFADHHRNFAALWAVVCDHYDEFGELPGEDEVTGELERRFDEDPEALSDEEVENLDFFIRRAYKAPLENIDAHIMRIAFRHLRVYLEDRIADRIRRDLTSSTYTPGDLCSLLGDYQLQVGRVASISPTGLTKPFPEGWNRVQEAVRKSDTKLDFLNRMLNGGQADKEVYGILGPHGSCKTTIAIQYSTQQANALREEWRAGGKQGVIKTVYFFFYEADSAEMRLRALSSLGMISRNTLELGDWEEMSQVGALKPYERRIWAHTLQSGQRVLCERERFRYVERALNVNWRLIDMTGNDTESPGRGWGLVDEIQQVVQMDQDYQQSQGINAGVGPIIIDYAGAAVKRYLDHHGKDYSSEIRHLVSSFPMQCKNKLAIKFRTTVLALHQLTGSANELASGILPKSTQAAEAKNWRENLDFSFIIGNPNQQAMTVFGCDKQRRGPRPDNVVLQIRGEFCRVEHAPQYAVDPHQQKIVLKSQLRSIEGDDDDDDGGVTYPSHHDDDDTEAVDHTTAETNAVRRPRSQMGRRRSEGR